MTRQQLKALSRLGKTRRGRALLREHGQAIIQIAYPKPKKRK